MGININIINFGRHSHMSILHRAELKSNFMGVKAGMKGWLEWNGGDFTFELDKPIYKSGTTYQYRIPVYGWRYYKNPQYCIAPRQQSNRNLIKRLTYIEATDEERIDYFIRKTKDRREVLAVKQGKSANYELIKEYLIKYTEEKAYDKANELIRNIVEDLKREDDIFTPLISSQY